MRAAARAFPPASGRAGGSRPPGVSRRPRDDLAAGECARILEGDPFPRSNLLGLARRRGAIAGVEPLAIPSRLPREHISSMPWAGELIA
eukprot:8911373-Pyramimonas_sp.AAC.1